MICATCGSKTSHLKYYRGVESCPNCGGFKEAGGVKTDSILTRNSFRVRTESIKHEQDFILPHTYSKTEGLKINEEFIKKYPNKAGDYFSDSQLIKEGYSKLPSQLKANKEAIRKEKAGVEFHGEIKKGIERILK